MSKKIPLASSRTGQETAVHLSMSQTVEAVVDCQHVVTLDESHPHGRADGGVHTSTGGADIHDGYIDVALVARSEICLFKAPPKKGKQI